LADADHAAHALPRELFAREHLHLEAGRARDLPRERGDVFG
jgi:hypothetical protein